MMDRSLRVLRGKEEAEVTDEPGSFEMFFAAEHSRLFGALCLVTGDLAAPESRFDAVIEAAAPIIGSIEFHAS